MGPRFPTFTSPGVSLRLRVATSLVATGMIVASPAVAASRDGDDGPIIGGNFLSTQTIDGRAWSLEANVNTLYDSNFRRSQLAEAGVRMTPSVNFGAGLPVGRQQLFIGGTIGRDVTFGHPELSRGRYAFGGGAAWRLGTRCSGIVGAEASQRLTFVTEQAELTDNVQNASVYGVSAGCRTATGLGFTATLERRTVTNDRPDRQAFDLRSTIFSPSVTYGSQTLGQFSVSATFNEVDYPNRQAPTLDGLVDEGVRIFQGRFGYSRSFGQRLQLSAGVSYLRTKPRPDMVLAVIDNQLVLLPQPGFSGSGYDLSINYQPSARLGVSLEGSRNISASPNVGARAVIRNAVGAELSYQLAPSLGFGLGGRLVISEYDQSFATPDTAARKSDNAKRVFASLDYSPVPLYSIALEIGHQWRRADPSTFDFDSTTARLSLRVKLGSG